MVEHPAEYLWSSYRVNAQSESSSLLTEHAVYQSLGLTERARTEAYRELFKAEMSSSLVDEIRQATRGNYALGSSKFKDQVEAALGRRASKGIAGRKRTEQ